ncbi:SpoIIE family protein phosphatase [Rhizobium jaguaris]|uniref:PP2C family protein-serine/threonine phosphatase n=1 Tax=Rhizobium jaguaris TaxID=1312183 RepID=UPI0039BF89ED
MQDIPASTSTIDDERPLATAGSGDAMARLLAEVEALRAENEDLKLLYEATIEHGEAVEDQLAESNMLLQRVQARLEEELNDALRYILSLLPQPRQSGPRADWMLVPSTELGGDSFGYHDIDADHFAIYLLDVCGHGVGAALLSASVINVLRASALPNADFRDPSAVLAGLNAAFPMEKQNNMFFTIWYGVYQRSTGQLVFSSGGHPPAILLHEMPDGSVSTDLLIGSGGMAIGAIDDLDYDASTVLVQPGDRLLVLSDGTYEIGTDGSEPLTFQDILDFTRKPGGDEPAAVLAWARAINGSETLPDDFSFLRVEF